MPRDLKVGFALGVMLVGVVGALFFRRDNQLPAPPALETAAEIDQEIAAKPHGPYMMGPEEFVDNGDQEPAAPAKLPKADAPAYEVPTFLSDADRAEQEKVLSGQGAGAPQPVAATPTRTQPSGTPQAGAPSVQGWLVGRVPPAKGIGGTTGQPVSNGVTLRDPLTEEDAEDEIKLPVDEPGHTGRDESGHSAAGYQSYVTKAGDTLSGLAGKFLGNQGKFRELYEMNRDVLRSPNDLPEGITLRVPNGRGAATQPAASMRPATTRPASPANPVGQGWETPTEAARPKSEKPVSTDDGEGPVVIREPGNGAKGLFRAGTQGRLGVGRVAVEASNDEGDEIREPAGASRRPRVIEKSVRPNSGQGRTPNVGEPVLGIE
jgi:nucleoid-associated protein YgaU